MLFEKERTLPFTLFGRIINEYNCAIAFVKYTKQAILNLGIKQKFKTKIIFGSFGRDMAYPGYYFLVLDFDLHGVMMAFGILYLAFGILYLEFGIWDWHWLWFWYARLHGNNTSTGTVCPTCLGNGASGTLLRLCWVVFSCGTTHLEFDFQNEQKTFFC